jgi:hypothetical protein
MIRMEDTASNAKLRTSPAIKDSAVAKDNRGYGYSKNCCAVLLVLKV